jgi:hypothetical protein
MFLDGVDTRVLDEVLFEIRSPVRPQPPTRECPHPSELWDIVAQCGLIEAPAGDAAQLMQLLRRYVRRVERHILAGIRESGGGTGGGTGSGGGGGGGGGGGSGGGGSGTALSGAGHGGAAGGGHGGATGSGLNALGALGSLGGGANGHGDDSGGGGGGGGSARRAQQHVPGPVLSFRRGVARALARIEAEARGGQLRLFLGASADPTAGVALMRPGKGSDALFWLFRDGLREDGN